jgi:hypothetical protein
MNGSFADSDLSKFLQFMSDAFFFELSKLFEIVCRVRGSLFQSGGTQQVFLERGLQISIKWFAVQAHLWETMFPGMSPVCFGC